MSSRRPLALLWVFAAACGGSVSGGPEGGGVDFKDDPSVVGGGDGASPGAQPRDEGPVLPMITSQPTSTTVPLDASFQLDVVATSATPITYQWFKGGQSMGDAQRTAGVAATKAQRADAGDYYVVVTNAAGSVTSATATLIVDDPGLARASNTKHAIGTLYDGKGFWEYLPKGYGGTDPVPLLIFFHGFGENGSGNSADLDKVQAWGPPQSIKQGTWPAERPFVVLAPQQQGDCPSADDVHGFLDFALAHYDIDMSRVYLTGLSCGAIGIAAYLAKYGSADITAAVPIAGDISPAWNAQGCGLVTDMPLWAFHGASDGTVSVNGDRTNMPKFAACPARQDVQYTEYPGVDHAESWVITYDGSAGHDIYAWMLGFER